MASLAAPGASASLVAQSGASEAVRRASRGCSLGRGLAIPARAPSGACVRARRALVVAAAPLAAHVEREQRPFAAELVATAR